MTDDKKHVLEKVRALFDRAGRLDTPMEEARTSALLGARLFVKHQLGLSEETELEELQDDFDRGQHVTPDAHVDGERYAWHEVHSSPSPRGAPRYDRHGPIPEPSSTRESPHDHSVHARSKIKARSKRAKPKSPSPPSDKKRSARAAAAQRVMRAWAASGFPNASGAPPDKRVRTKYITITSDYTGKCLACRKGYVPGEALAWRPQEGVTHYGCRAFWDGHLR